MNKKKMIISLAGAFAAGVATVMGISHYQVRAAKKPKEFWNEDYEDDELDDFDFEMELKAESDAELLEEVVEHVIEHCEELSDAQADELMKVLAYRKGGKHE